MKLCQPLSIRLTPELLRQLDAWRGDRMSRGTAIRLLLERAISGERSAAKR
jgi:metal-responsive CopG/Arc/MetJ family transcriptional regulator